jgi:sortase A
MRRSVWVSRSLLAIGAGLLGYCAFVLVEGWQFQRAEDRQLEQLSQTTEAAGGSVTEVAPAGLRFIPPPAADGLIGRLEIPRLGVSVIVMEGTGRATLRHAIGHIAGMALPGQSGNVGIAGHRDTFFRPLRNIRQDDIIAVTTPSGTFRYRVVSMSVVQPGNVEVLDDTHDEVLTLVTCYPFYFAGPAPDRFIVRAQRIT